MFLGAGIAMAAYYAMRAGWSRSLWFGVWIGIGVGLFIGADPDHAGAWSARPRGYFPSLLPAICDR